MLSLPGGQGARRGGGLCSLACWGLDRDANRRCVLIQTGVCLRATHSTQQTPLTHTPTPILPLIIEPVVGERTAVTLVAPSLNRAGCVGCVITTDHQWTFLFQNVWTKCPIVWLYIYLVSPPLLQWVNMFPSFAAASIFLYQIVTFPCSLVRVCWVSLGAWLLVLSNYDCIC